MKILKSRLNQNIFYLFIVQISRYALPLVTFPYLVRVLGPTGFGVLGFCQATIQYFVILTEYGFNYTGTELISHNRENKEKITQIFWGVTIARLVLMSIGFIVLFFLVLLVPSYFEFWPIFIALTPTVIGAAIYPSWFFQGVEEMKFISFCTLIARFISVPAIFVFVKESQDIWIAALLQGAVMLLSGVLGCYILIKKKWVGKVCFDKIIILDLFKQGWYVFVSTSAISLYTTSTTVILGFICGPVAVGYFNAANTIRNAAQGLLTPVSQALFPRIGFLYKEDYKKAELLLRKSVKVLGGLALIGSSLLFISSPLVIKYLVGSNYTQSVMVLHCLAFVPLFVTLSNIFGVQTMLTHGYKREFSKIIIASGVLNLIILFPLVSFYEETGAALATLATEFFVFISMYLFLRCRKVVFHKL
ncbi:flippase [Kosakonia cowanii]